MDRRAVAVLVVMVGGVACGSSQRARGHAKLTAKEIVQKASPAIVRVEADDDKVGTGFIVDGTAGKGLIATNLHVVAGATRIRIHTFDGKDYQVARIGGLDPDRDLALLEINDNPALPTLTIGDSDVLTAGDPITAIGNPLGVLDYSVSNGLISSVRVLSPELKLLQISAPISQGSSGGPLFNQFGEVVGVTTAIITAGQNLNLAVPSNYLHALLDHHTPLPLAEFAKATAEPDPHSLAQGAPPPGQGPKIIRQVPRHEIAAVAGCSRPQMVEIAQQISEAIDNGAPLYNAGNHEACFRIYEGTALKWQREAPCVGVREAFGDGLLRANSVDSPTEKAWAMRDTFDGLIDVFARWAQANP